VSESGGTVIEAAGELITSQYFDLLAAEVDDLLQVRRSCAEAERQLREAGREPGVEWARRAEQWGVVQAVTLPTVA
jgi:hypothetical protein